MGSRLRTLDKHKLRDSQTSILNQPWPKMSMFSYLIDSHLRDDAFSRSSYSLRDLEEERDLRRFGFFKKVFKGIKKLGRRKSIQRQDSEEWVVRLYNESAVTVVVGLLVVPVAYFVVDRFTIFSCVRFYSLIDIRFVVIIIVPIRCYF